MAKQIEGVSDRVLECAKKEFMEKGYQDASLRTIAKEASTSTSSIYTRFKDKDGLFRALVEPVIYMIKTMSSTIQSEFDEKDAKTQEEVMGEFTNDSHKKIIDFIYDHQEIFYLLTACSHGSSYEHFMDELVEIEEESTIKYLKVIGREDLILNTVTREFLHILATSYCYGIFEPVLHGMSREKAHEFDEMFLKYHMAGFYTLLEK